MARPFICWTTNHETEMQWLRDLLLAIGFEQPIILGLGGSPRPPVDEIQEQMKKADCLFGLVAAGPGGNAPAPDPRKMSDWIRLELTAAMVLRKPIGVLVDKSIEMPPEMYQAFTWRQVDLSNSEAILRAVPAFIEQALKIKYLTDPAVLERRDTFIFDEIHVINRLSREAWRQTRSITLTAAPGFESRCVHSVDVGMDKTPGLSVKLADETRDLKVTVRDRPESRVRILRNEDLEVEYHLDFQPRLRPTETVRYRHVSVHPNIFPLTVEEIRSRMSKDGHPPFMRDGLVGDNFDVRYRVERLILELRSPLELGLSDPQLRVYVTDALDEIEEERTRIGNPKVARDMWEVREDPETEESVYRVSISRPTIGWSYALLVRPLR